MILYTTPTCGPCRTLKAAMVTEGLDAGVVIKDNPADFPPEVKAVPTLKVSEDQFITGMQYILSHLRHKKESAI